MPDGDPTSSTQVFHEKSSAMASPWMSKSRLAQNTNWALEVINREGTSTVWDDLFETDDDAVAEFTATVEQQGVRAFLDDSNVIDFPRFSKR